MYSICILVRYDPYIKRIVSLLHDIQKNIGIYIDNQQVTLEKFLSIDERSIMFSSINVVGYNRLQVEKKLPKNMKINSSVGLYKCYLEQLNDFDFVLIPYGGESSFECFILIAKNKKIIQQIVENYSTYNIIFSNFIEEKQVPQNLIGNFIYNIKSDDNIYNQVKAYISNSSFGNTFSSFLQSIKPKYAIIRKDVNEDVECYLQNMDLFCTVEPDYGTDLVKSMLDMKSLGLISSFEYKKLYIYHCNDVNDIVKLTTFCIDHRIPIGVAPQLDDNKQLSCLLSESESFYTFSDICYINKFYNSFDWYFMAGRGDADIAYAVFIVKDKNIRDLFLGLKPKIAFTI